MKVTIKKLTHGIYAATVIQNVFDPGWSTEPLPLDQLIDELLKLGFHQTDIGDALYEADPDWLKQ